MKIGTSLARNFLKKLFRPLFLRVDCSQSQDASIKPLCRVCSQKLKLLWSCVAFIGLSEYHVRRYSLCIPVIFSHLGFFPISVLPRKAMFVLCKLREVGK